MTGRTCCAGFEFCRGRLIAYSAGNLVGCQVLADHDELGAGMVLQVALTPDGTFDSASITPMRMDSATGAANADPQRRASALVRTLSAQHFPGTAARVAATAR